MFFNKIKYFFSILISLIFIFVTIQNINFDSNHLRIDHVLEKKFLLSLYLILFIPVHYLISLKFCKLFLSFKKISIINSIKVNLIAYTYNLILPAKAGDFLRFNFLGLKTNNQKKIFNFNLIEKLISFITIFFLIFLSVFLIDFEYIDFVIKVSQRFKLYLFIFFIIILFALPFLIKKILVKISLNKLIPFNKLFFFDILIWCIIFFQILIAVEILDIKINYFEIIFIFGISIVAGLIPVSIGGFGVRDFVIFNLLSLNTPSHDIFLLLIFFNLRYLIPLFLGLIISLNYAKNQSKIR